MGLLLLRLPLRVQRLVFGRSGRVFGLGTSRGTELNRPLATFGPSGATRPLKLCGSLLTSCWKEPDSNPRPPVTSSPIFGDTNLLVTNMEQGGVAIGGSRWRHQPRHSPAPVHHRSMREGAPLSPAAASGCGCRYR